MFRLLEIQNVQVYQVFKIKNRINEKNHIIIFISVD